MNRRASPQAGEYSRYASWAEDAAFDPQVVLVAPCGFDLPRTLSEAKQLPRGPGWQNLSAARNDKVFAMDGNALLNRSGPRLIESLELLAQLIQPRLIGDSNLQQYWQRNL